MLLTLEVKEFAKGGWKDVMIDVLLLDDAAIQAASAKYRIIDFMTLSVLISRI